MQTLSQNHHADQTSLKGLNDAQYDAWKQVIESQVGLVFEPHLRHRLEQGLLSRMKANSIYDFDHYYRWLILGEGNNNVLEWSLLLNKVTVRETYFYRHAASFDILETYLSQRWEEDPLANLTLWSMGCASGEEAYSMAICADTCSKKTPTSKHFAVIGTDVSHQALSQARLGIYPAKALQNLQPHLQSLYFEANANENKWQITTSLKRKVCCVAANALDMPLTSWQPVDVIFCQNLLIYFRRWQQHDVLNMMCDRLKSGGMMVLGVGEAMQWRPPSFMKLLKDKHVRAFVRT